MESSHLIFLGTYTRDGSRGIHALRLDARTGALSAPILVAETPNPAWLALSPDRKFLYAIHDSASQAVGFAVDAENVRLTPLPAPGHDGAQAVVAAPSHLAIDATGRTLLAANYRDGYVAAVPIAKDGTLGPPRAIRHFGRSVHPTRQEKPHPHSVTVSPDNRWVVVCDLGLDRIFTYALDSASAQLAPANPGFVATAPGAGPRHFKFSADGRRAYAINELASTLTTYDFDTATGTLTPRHTAPTLPAGYNGESTTAEVRLHPNGRFLYGSNRGHDSIAVFQIDLDHNGLVPVEIVPSGGAVPRNFALSPDGAWLVCGHQDSGNLTVFQVDGHSGRLTATGHSRVVSMAVCVLFYG